MSVRPWLPGEARRELKARIDARVRELRKDELPPQNEHGTDRAWRDGCRCAPCREKQNARRRAYRQAHLERERQRELAYKPRRNALLRAKRAGETASA